MAGVITKAGLRSLGSYAGTVQNWLKSLTLRTFSNNHVPDAATDSNADYTESAYSGYASQAWNDWGGPSLDANNNDKYDCPPHVFTRSAGATSEQVYGMYATDGAGDVVLAESNGVTGGVPMTLSGSTYTVTGHFYVGQIVIPL